MQDEHASLSHVSLVSGTSYIRPPELPQRVYLDSPALDVMTDFRYVRPRTTTPDVPIDVSLEYMKEAGVRLLLVTDELDQAIGIVTSYDIQGERPIKIAEDQRISRADIRVEQVMTPQRRIQVLNLLSVRNAQVGNIVSTLHALELRHVLVVEAEDYAEPVAVESGTGPAARMPHPNAPPNPRTVHRASKHWIRGLFSGTQISRQLRRDIDEVMTAAHSLAEMVQELR